jgi:hypothetical protein
MEYYKKYPYSADSKKIAIEDVNFNGLHYFLSHIAFENSSIEAIETNYDNRKLMVTYRKLPDDFSIKVVIDYHLKTYGETLMRIEKKISKNHYFYENFKNSFPTGSEFVYLDKYFNIKINYNLNEKYELIEYKEIYYSDEQNPEIEKRFFPKQWHIDTDELA